MSYIQFRDSYGQRGRVRFAEVQPGDWVLGPEGPEPGEVREVIAHAGCWVEGMVDRADGIYRDRYFAGVDDLTLIVHPHDARLPSSRVEEHTRPA